MSHSDVDNTLVLGPSVSNGTVFVIRSEPIPKHNGGGIRTRSIVKRYANRERAEVVAMIHD
jgi:hypothetical protein